jgi:hypothetical protein
MQMETMMKRLKKGGMAGMMRSMNGLMGGKNAVGNDDIAALAAQMDPDALGADMDALKDMEQSPLGTNPFAPGGAFFKG